MGNFRSAIGASTIAWPVRSTELQDKPKHGFFRSTIPHENVTFFSGIHLLSDEGLRWIEHQVGEEVNRAKLSAFELPWTNPRRIHDYAAVSSDLPPELPRRKTVEVYVLRFTSSFTSLVFPVISKTLFMKTLDLAYGPRGVFGSTSANACVYSFISLVSLFGFDDNTHGAVDCGSYASTALRAVPHIIEEMTVDGLQSLMMLVHLQYFLGDLQSAAVTISIATRLLYKLGAHTNPAGMNSSVHLPPYNKAILEYHVRDLFWVCYSFDKDISLRMGQPASINDFNCDLSLPLEYVRLQNSNIQRDELKPDDHTLPLYPWDLRLSMIKSEAYNTLYSVNASFKSDCQILESIRCLDAALDEWRLSLHSEIRPTLCFSSDMSTKAKLNTQEVILRLAYYHCMSIIHQASDRRNISKLDAGIGLEGISSSVNLSTTACRSTLSLLQTRLPTLKGECFWVLLFYILTANLTLFCNILKDPLQSESSQDVAILREVPAMINKIPIRNLTPAEMIHLSFLNGFTTELARLAMCAVLKAQKESRNPGHVCT
ncbi:Transcription factor [Penicillium canescens]|nr:Transcription factor [Penicillium canescens]